MWDVLSPNDAAKLLCNEERQLGRLEQKDTGKRKSHRNGPSREYANLTRKWQRMNVDVWALCRKF